MKKCKKIFIMVLSAFMLSGLFSIVSAAQELSSVSSVQERDQSRQAVDPGRPTHPFTVIIPAQQGNIATGQFNTTSHGNQRVHLHWPGQSVWARIITGTNNNPGSWTNWQYHLSFIHSTRTHHTNLPAGHPIRVQLRAMSNTGSFSATGSISP